MMCEKLDFGPWHYDAAARAVWLSIPGHSSHAEYYVDLARSHTAEARCDWLAQIAEKTWATPEILGQLVLAFDSLVGMRPGSLTRPD